MKPIANEKTHALVGFQLTMAHDAIVEASGSKRPRASYQKLKAAVKEMDRLTDTLLDPDEPDSTPADD